MKSHRKRNGLSLLEVLLAIAILGGSLAIIGQLVRIGANAALATRLRSEANIIADSKMAELSAGVVELQSYGITNIPENPGWYYQIDVQNSEQLGLLIAKVTVGQTGIEAPLTVAIERFIPDPDYDPLEAQQESE